MKVIVYTSIIGNIDRLWSAMPGCSDVEHIAFVDAPRFEVGQWSKAPSILPDTGSIGSIVTWEQRISTPTWGARRTARHYKALPHHYLPEHDVSIWVDGNVRLRVHPLALAARYPDSDLVTFKHWDRSCLYAEAMFCDKVHKDNHATLAAQIARYAAAGMPTHWGLAATRVVIRRNTPAMRALNEAWWTEIERGSLRDQVSLPFVCWQQGVRWAVLPGVLKPGTASGDALCVAHDKRRK